jgi:hypothetical protein
MVTITSGPTSGIERWAEDEAEARQIELPYRPFAKQQAFHASPAKYRLFGGAAGPGKSKALLMEAILQANENPGANTLLLRRTFPELEQSLLLYFRRDVPRELYQSYNESKHLVTWWNGSTTRFGYCQNENDVYQYQGAEFLFIGIDELTLFTLRQWQFLTSRNRCPVPGAFPCMAGATNPGNIGHAWVKSLWIDKRPAPGMENPAEYDPAEYDFIPARVSDNPIYAGDENYLKTLRALPSAHAGPSCVVTYREYVTHRTPPRELAREIIARSASSVDSTREKIDAVYLSPDAFARRTDEASIAEQMGDVFAAAGFPRPVPADDDRVGGWMLMYQMLDSGEWLLTENCIELIRTLPNLVRDPARVEDVEKMDGDDPADAARYGLKSRYGARRGDPGGWRSRMPLADRLAARVLSPDPTIGAMQARKAQLEEMRRTQPVRFRRGRRH